MAFADTQQSLLELTRALGEKYKFSVYDGALPTGDQLRSTQGRYWPYVVFGAGGKSSLASRNRGITSSADDAKLTALIFYCVGDTPTTVRRLKQVLREEFEGYVPHEKWGQFEEILTGDFGISKPDPDLIPLRFGETLAFRCVTDE